MLSQSLGHRTNHICSLLNLIGKALTKIQMEAVGYAYLIAPAWPVQIQYPQVLRMLTRAPILLPMSLDLLKNPDQSPHPLLVEEWMFLTTWPGILHARLFRLRYQHAPPILEDPHTRTLSIQLSLKKWIS